MNIGEWLEKGGELTVIVDHSADLELAKQPTHGNHTPCFEGCDCAAVYAARARLERAGVLTRGSHGGYHPPAPRRSL